MKQLLNRKPRNFIISSVFLALLLCEVVVTCTATLPTKHISMFYFTLPLCGTIFALALLVANLVCAKCQKTKPCVAENISLLAIALSYLATYIQFLLRATLSPVAGAYKGIASYYGVCYNIAGKVADLTGQTQELRQVNATIVAPHFVVVIVVFVLFAVMFFNKAEGVKSTEEPTL